jgi:hypothetical protein
MPNIRIVSIDSEARGRFLSRQHIKFAGKFRGQKAKLNNIAVKLNKLPQISVACQIYGLKHPTIGYQSKLADIPFDMSND